MRKVIIIVLCIVVVAIGAAAIVAGVASRNGGTSGGAVAPITAPSSSPTVDTSGWKTFTSSVFGFSFEYPPTWQSSGDSVTVVNPHIFFGNPLNGTTTYALMVFVYDNPHNLSAADYVSAMLASDTAADAASGAASGTAPPVTPQFSRQFALTLDGSIPAYELYNVFEFDHGGEQVYAQDGTHIILFDFPVAKANPNIADPAANNAIAHAIVNTLRVVK